MKCNNFNKIKLILNKYVDHQSIVYNEFVGKGFDK